MKYYSVDRIEEDIAVLVDDQGEALEILLSQLPAEVKEGTVVSIFDGAYVIEQHETDRRRQEVQSLIDDLFV